jgi:hypothetical protein
MLQILQMKLTGTAELVVVVALVGLISFAPKLLSFIVSSPVGKAVAFGFVAYLWKQHNELVALLLAVALLKACPSYEYAGKEGDSMMAPSKPPASKPKKEDMMGGDNKY